MVTNALVPALPYLVESQLIPQRYLLETVQQYTEEIVLSRTKPSQRSISKQQSDNLPFTPRETFQQRTSFAGDFLSGFTSRRSSPGQRTSSPWADDPARSATYGNDACLMTTPVDKGTYVDIYF